MFSEDRHPRPDFKREHWILLDGEWDFCFDEGMVYTEAGKVIFDRKIMVPYVYQSQLSGINDQRKCDCVWYRKQFEMNNELKPEEKVILHFGACDYEARVFVNGRLAMVHNGGYSSFHVDITDSIHWGKNEITVRVVDCFEDKSQPRGKQTWTCISPFGCVYTAYTGLWQSVWLEFVHTTHIEAFTVVPDIDERSIHLTVTANRSRKARLKIQVTYQGKKIKEHSLIIGKDTENTTMEISHKDFPWEGIALWSAEAPNLYELCLELWKDGKCLDKVDSYFGMRKIEKKEGKIFINDYPQYQKLLLNQGYYPGGLVTPQNVSQFAEDIRLIKAMGFNGIRIHEKIENPLFLYECDRQGLYVWEEMPSAYEFSQRSMKRMITEWQAIIERDKNHPSIITWVTMNESWGVFQLRYDPRQQAFVRALYQLTKAMDPTRLVVDNDGWEHTETDICTIHDYAADGNALYEYYQNKEKLLSSMPSPLYPRFVFADGYTYHGQPVILSEYGGIALDGSDGWGYDGKAADEKQLLDRLEVLTDAIKRLDYVCGYCYTQFTDIEAEQNGLLNMDRTPKVTPGEILRINQKPAKWL